MLLVVWQCSGAASIATNNIARLPAPTKGPRLTATRMWNRLSPSVASWPAPSRLSLMKASLIAFVSLNDAVDGEGDALVEVELEALDEHQVPEELLLLGPGEARRAGFWPKYP